MELFLVGVALVIAGLIIQKFRQEQNRRKLDEQRQLEETERQSKIDRLKRKYGSDPYLRDILAGQIRQGMTLDHVVDAWGPPSAREQRVLKTKIVETLKYAPSGRSYLQQVKIENGLVVGWTNR